MGRKPSSTVSQGPRLRAVPPSLARGLSCSAGHQSSQQEGEEFGGRREIMGARPRSGKHLMCQWGEHRHSGPLPACVCAQSCLTLCNPKDCSPQGSSVHGILQARIVEWPVKYPSPGDLSPKTHTHVPYIPCIGRWVLHHYRHNETEQDPGGSWA